MMEDKIVENLSLIRSDIRVRQSQAQERLGTSANNKIQIYRFDLFKGFLDDTGKLVKVRSVGSAFLREGLKTYTVHLKTFLQDQFYLLPNTKEKDNSDYVLLTREPSKTTGKKYFWNRVGEGHILDSDNPAVARLSFDLLDAELYMNLHPIRVTEVEAEAPEDNSWELKSA